MRQLFLQMPHTRRARLIASAIVLSCVAGASPLVYDSPLAPLLVGGGVASMAIGVAWLRKPVWVLYAAIFVAFLPTGLLPNYIQSSLNRLTLVLAASAWLLDLVIRRRHIVWTGATLWMLGFLTWVVVTLSWAPSVDYGVERITEYALRIGLFLILVINEIDSGEALHGLMSTLALNGLVLAMAGAGTALLQGYHPGGTGFQVLAMNQNEIGTKILVAMPGVLWLAIAAPKERRRPMMALSMIFVLLAIILVAFSGSRGGAIALLATLSAFWIGRPTRPWGRLGLLILVVAVISAPFLFSTVVRRFVAAEEGVLGGREVIWQAGWLLIQSHFWNGVGIGNAGEVLALSPLVARYVRYIGGRQVMSFHNPVMQIWADVGIPGLLLYLGSLGSAVWSFVRQRSQCRESDRSWLVSYFALVSSVFVGYMLLWIKGGGMEQDHGYFLMLALLLLPARLNFGTTDGSKVQKME